MNILACAVGFGLGPSGKLCSIINSNKQYNWYACGDKLNLSIYRENPFIDVCWLKNEKMLKDFIRKHDIKCAVNVLDPDLAILFKKIGIKVVYIDSLSFMWTSADIIPYNVDYYCAQKYPEYKKNPALEDIKKFIWINPITLGKIEEKDKKGIVINFGGLHSPFGEGKEYFQVIMESLMHILDGKDVIITGGENVIELAKKLYPKFLSITYSHEDFLKTVSSSELFITSPGLTTIYETCMMNIDTIIMPPQNLSQFYNIDIAEKICKKVKVLSWNNKNLSKEKIKLFHDKPEEETVKYIYEQIYNLSTNDEEISEFKEYVMNKLKNDFIINNIKTFENNGTEQISDILNKIMEEYKDENFRN